jgi:enoyl-CoA hydratase/carnithine racemase
VVRVERHGSTVVWTIDRPETKNALDQATFSALSDAIAKVDTSVRAAIITGAGDAFVSGGDLRELRDKTTRGDAEQLTDTGHALCAAIEALPFPVIAAMRGPAIGGGAELAVACDVRIADTTATIAFKQARLGVTTSWGTVPRLISLVGPGLAGWLLYAGESVNAHLAENMGLVDVLDDGALETAIALGETIAKSSPRAVAGMKRLVRASCARPDVRVLERELFVDTWSGEDHLEAVEAYFAKRAPAWRDR